MLRFFLMSQKLVDKFPSPIKSASKVPDSVDVYRQTLSAAADRSVAISSIGLLTNLEALLKSRPDQHSKLSGYDLVAQKVKLLAVMGGKYPDSRRTGGKYPGPECNLCGGQDKGHPGDKVTAHNASGYVFSHMPPEVRIVYSGDSVGASVQSGAVLSSCAPTNNPCRAAMINFEGGEGKSRYSFDPLNTLLAVRGAAGASCTACTNCSGVNIVDGNTGNNWWQKGPESNQTYTVLKNNFTAGMAIDALLCQTPKHVAAKPTGDVVV